MPAAYPTSLTALFLFCGWCAAPSEAQTAAVDWVPDRALATIQVREPDQLLAAFRETLDRHSFSDSKLYERIMEDGEITQARMMLAGFAASANTDPWGAIAAALGEDMALGLAPTGGQGPAVALIVRLRDAELVDQLLNPLLTLGGLIVDGEPNPDRSKQMDGLTVYQLESDSFLSRIDNSLVIANSERVLEMVLAVREGRRKSISTTARYRDALKDVPRDAAAWAWVDLQRLVPVMERNREEAGRLRNPFAAFMFGGWYHTLRQSPYAVGWVELGSDLMRLEARWSAKEPLPGSHRGFMQNITEQVNWSARSLPDYLAEIQVGRGWADLFGERESLVTLAGVSDVNNFSTTVSNLFGGIDFQNDVLPNVGGPVRFIMTRQTFDETKPVPVPKLPAFALVAPLKPDAPPSLRQRLFSAAQMSLSIINLDQAQKGEPAYLLDMDRHRDTRMVFTEFADYGEAGMQMDAPSLEETDEAQPDEVSTRFNFRPAVAIVANQVVIATSDDLLRGIIDASLDQLGAASELAVGQPTSDLLQVDGPSLKQILQDNHRELVVNRMLEESQSKADATGEIDALLEILGYVAHLQANVEHLGGGYEFEMELKLNESRAK